MSYTEPTNALVLENSLPMSDTEGKAQSKYFEFTVMTHATTNASDSTGVTIPYEINISDITTTNEKVEKYFVKLNLVKVSGTTEEEVLAPTKITGLTSSSLRENATKVYETSDTHKNGSSTITTKYRLRAWLDKDYAITNKNTTTYQYKFRVNVNSEVNALGINKEQEETAKYLSGAILEQGVVTTGDGLYKSNATNTTQPTYYYRGSEVNNYVKMGKTSACSYNGLEVVDINTMASLTEAECANVTNLCSVDIDMLGVYLTNMSESDCGSENYISATPEYKEIDMKWRVVRINEDGTIRLIYDNWMISSVFNPNSTELKYMYYSESNVEGGIKKTLNDWYSENLSSYDLKIATSTYCEALPNKLDFKCEEDENGYGLITDQKVGLITVQELVHAGGVLGDQSSYYLSNKLTWSISPVGFDNPGANAWFTELGFIYNFPVCSAGGGLPVISLNADVLVTGLGTSDKPWIVQ